MNPLNIIGAVLSVIIPTLQSSDMSKSTPVPSAGVTVSPVTTITNAVGIIAGTLLIMRGFDEGTASTLGGGLAAILAALLNQLHIVGGTNVNTLAQQTAWTPVQE